MKNPFKREASDAERWAQGWKFVLFSTEQFVEGAAVETPELIKGLADSRQRWKAARQAADQEANL